LLPPEKVREKESGILEVYLETILLLCTTRPAREYLRLKKVYPVIRQLHLVVEDDRVRLQCEKIVSTLMRGEADENKGGTLKLQEIEPEGPQDSDDEILVI
jgi:hypothetical protein